MKRKQHYLLQLFTVALLAVATAACNGEQEKDNNNQNNKLPEAVPAQITAPFNNEDFFVGDFIELTIQVNKPEAVSNLAVSVNGVVVEDNLESTNQTIAIPTKNKSVGPMKIAISYTDDKGKTRADNREVILFSDIQPEFVVAQLVNTYPHSKTSYTQGLEFYNGKLYEGTGQYNQSILAEVDLQSGTKIREIALDGTVFGEGITILNDTIYQITYRSQICYVYDMDFNQLTTFMYDGEGWGLTNDGKHIIMSNGSDQLVWRDPKTFKVVKTLPVFDNEKSIVNLNELELIEGDIYANIYTESKLVQIDTSNGKVLRYLDCNRIMNDANEPGNDVLNGIAHNPETGKTYLTGKWWSKLYEVQFE